MKTLLDFCMEHKGIAAMAGAWLMREIPLVWRSLKAIYPYLAENGGVGGVVNTFLHGKPKAPVLPVESKTT